MGDTPSPFDAGYGAAKRAISDAARRRKKKNIQWRREDYAEFNREWEQFLDGWMKAIKEDREKQLSWDEFYGLDL